MTDNARIAIEKLNNKNYQTWKFKMELLLIKEDLWDVVIKERPAVPTEDWLKRDGKARAAIGLLVEDNQLQHVKKENSSKGAWDSLRRYHERATISSKVFLLKRLSKLKYNESSSIEDHLNSMLAIIDELAALGEVLKDNLIVAFMLCSLPDTYDSLITALETRPEDDLTIELVKGKLIQEYERRKEAHENNFLESATKEETALKTHEKKSFARFKENKNLECNYCHKFGHFKRDCFKLKNRRKNYQARQVTEVNTVSDTNHEEREFVCFSITGQQNKENHWYVDSGATSHMTSDKSFFSKFSSLDGDSVHLANGDMLSVLGIGEGTLTCKTDEKLIPVVIKDILYVPDLKGNLLSVRKLAEKGFLVQFSTDECRIMKNGLTVATARAVNQLYILNCDIDHDKAWHVGEKGNCIHIWHRRFGHRHPESIHKLKNEELVKNLEICNCNAKLLCEPCIRGKMARKPFPKSSKHKSTKVLDLVHSDICGPMQTPTPSNNKYVLTFVDDYSGYTVIYLLRSKDEALNRFREYVRFTENKFGHRVKILRSDRGGEYIGREFKEFLAREGIEHQKTVPYTPQQNGVAERKNRTLTEATRCMLIDADLPNKYWGEAIMAANYVQNMSPSHDKMKTPFELWNNIVPDVSHLRIFGCKVYGHVPKQQRQKLDDVAKSYRFVGYEQGTKGYRLLDEATDKVIISRDVHFIELHDSCYDKWNNKENVIQNNVPNEDKLNNTLDEISVDVCDSNIKDKRSDETVRNNQIDEIPQTAPILRRSERSNKGVPPLRFATLVTENDSNDPVTPEQAFSRPDAEMWKQAMNEEMETLMKNQTWSLEKLPQNKEVIGCKWIFKRKYNADGNVSKYKARLVAQGFSQKFGEDYDEIFAPVVKQTTIKTLLAVASMKGMKVRHYDVKAAFLNGKLEETIYMQQPPNYEVKSSENLVCKLNKSLYGLKQSARAWYKRIHSELANEGFRRGEADPCLYSKQIDNEWIYILIYVDDLMITSSNISLIESTAQVLSQLFAISDLGEIKFYLGLEIERNENGEYYMHQQSYIKRLLDQFNMDNSKESKIPLDPGYMKNINKSVELRDNRMYRQLIGSLLYIATNTRPDIAAAVSILSRRVSCPQESDWIELKRILRYLKGTQSLRLMVGSTSNDVDGLLGYADADWCGDITDRKSNSGYIFFFNGSTISWSSRKQTLVALSTTEAEYIALAEAAQEAKWLILLLKDFNVIMNKPAVIYEDNQSCLKMLECEGITQRSKHIDVKFHFVKNLRENGIISFKYCPSSEMTADALTKPLEATKIKKFRELMGLK